MPDIPIVVLGGGAVGKSCLTIQYIQGHFVEKYDATIEDVYRKPVDIDGVSSVLTIVDTAGQEAFSTMREQYMKTGQGFVLVYSITDVESFQQLKKIYAQLRRTKGEGAPISCIVVGNKLDLSAQRGVSTDEGQVFARQTGCQFMEVSAKDRLHVEEVFTTLVRTIRSDKAGQAAATTAPTSDGPQGNGQPAAQGGGAARVSSAPSSNPTGTSAAGKAASAPQPAPVQRRKKKKGWCTML